MKLAPLINCIHFGDFFSDIIDLSKCYTDYGVLVVTEEGMVEDQMEEE